MSVQNTRAHRTNKQTSQQQQTFKRKPNIVRWAVQNHFVFLVHKKVRQRPINIMQSWMTAGDRVWNLKSFFHEVQVIVLLTVHFLNIPGHNIIAGDRFRTSDSICYKKLWQRFYYYGLFFMKMHLYFLLYSLCRHFSREMLFSTRYVP